MLRLSFRFAVLLILLSCLAPTWAALEDNWSGIERVIAVGDVHGDYEQFVAVLRLAGVIDADGNWSAGKAHLVQTGDVLDRGGGSRKAMDLLMNLEKQAVQAGGQVHALIANHEAMNMYGDLRYVTPAEYAAYQDEDNDKVRDMVYKQHKEHLEASPPPGGLPKFDKAYREKWEAQQPPGYFGHRAAFSPKGKYGKWIRGHNSVIRIDDTLFMHGGLSLKYARYSLHELNQKIRDELEDFSKLQGGITMDFDGPLWYRGFAEGDEASKQAELDKVLAQQKARRMVIGHTVTGASIKPRFGGKVIMIDVGLARVYGGPVACLAIENGKFYAIEKEGKRELP
jgi:hypothetical protein